MCLHSISEKKPAPEGFGYKIFRVWDGDPGPMHYGYGDYRKRRWYRAEKQRLRSSGLRGYTYQSGFHIMTQRPAKSVLGGESHQIWRVKYRRARVRGIDKTIGNLPRHCIVADEMMILEKVA